jgi:hypothetical protein
MSLKVTANLVFALALCGLFGCAKADYYEKKAGVGPLSTLSADNDLIIAEGEKKDFTVQLTTAADHDEVVHWRIQSDKYDVKERFKNIEGTATVAKGQRDLHISVAAADVDAIQQGDQLFDVELDGATGKTTVPLTLLDVAAGLTMPNLKNTDDRDPRIPKSLPRHRFGQNREVTFDINDSGTQPLVKVLLVIDNSYSMKLKQNQLAEGIRSIAKSLAGKNLQFFLYTTSNDFDQDGRHDKLTTQIELGQRTLHAPFQDHSLIINQAMPQAAFELAVSDLQRNILDLGHVGSKNESALCSLQNILHETDPKKQILRKGDDALVFILSDTDDHSRDVPVKDCGGVVSPRKIISKLDALLGRNHYGVTAVISNHAANKGHACGNLILDEGVKYTELVKSSPTPNQIFSICAKDYSESLDSVNVFSKQSIVNEFNLDLQAGESLEGVDLLRGEKEVALSKDQFELRNATLRIARKLLQPRDRVRVTIKRIQKKAP